MNKRPLVLVAVVLAILFASCSQGGKSGLLVPKDAAFVMHINLKSLSGKLSWEEIKQSDWFQRVQREEKDSFASKLLNNPGASGIDMESDWVIHVARYNGSGYSAFQGKIKDAAAYEQTVTTINENKSQVNTDGDLKYAEIGTEGLLAWTKDRFVMVNNVPLDAMNAGWGGERRSRSMSQDTLLKLTRDILALKGDKLLDNDKRFASLIGEQGDLHLWFNTASFAGNSLGMVTSMMKVGVLLDGNIGAATLNFDNGKITLKGTQYYGDEMTALLKKHTPKNVGSDITNRLPAGNVLAAGVFNFPPKGLQELAKLTGTDGMINGFLGEYSFSVDEFISANKGDITFALLDLGMTRDSISYEGLDGKKEYYVNDKPDLSFVAGVSVNNKEAFGKMISIIQQQTKGMDQANPEIEYSFGDDWFIAGSNKANVEAFKAGNNKPAYADKISGHHSGFYVDLQTIMGKVKQLEAEKGKQLDSTKTAMLESSLALWQDVIVHGDVKDGKVVSTVEVNLVDKNTNSLKQLNKYFDAISKNVKRESSEWDMEIVDSVALPPAPVK